MKQAILTLLLTVLGFANVAAQTDGEQVLVFRNTGDINLFYSSEIDSIVVSDYDADSVLHDAPVSQVFYTKDTIMLVPLAEIDSVAFGNRNTMEFCAEVRQITADSIWILRYDGTNIYYKGDTPAEVLPTTGEKVFYGTMDERFPAGLTAVVNSVSKVDGEHVVGVSAIGLDEIFSRLFYAGEINMLPTDEQQRKQSRAAIELKKELKGDLPLGDFGSMGVAGDIAVKGKAVVAPLRGYYNIDATVDTKFKSNVKLTAAKISTGNKLQKTILTVPLGIYAFVFQPEINVNLFAEIDGEMKFDTEFSRSFSTRVLWTRQSGKDDVFDIKNNNNSKEGYKDEAKIEVLCNGSLFVGLNPVVNFKVIGDVAGARAKFKVGPVLSGQVGFSMIRDLSQYNSELYAKASLEAALRLKTVFSLYHIGLPWEDEQEKEFLPWQKDFFKYKINLFPDYYETKGVLYAQKDSVEVSTATKSKNEIIRDLETGFEVVNAQGNVLDSMFVDTIKANTTSAQGVETTFVFSTNNVKPTEQLVLRPVFHYAGVTVRAADVAVMSDMQIQPMVFGQSNGAVTYLSGVPFSGSAVGNGTFYMAGPYLPIPVNDTVFAKKKVISTGIFLGEENDITGTWIGNEYGVDVTYSFNADGTGYFADDNGQKAFTYTKDNPQAGNVTMIFDAGGTKTIRVTFYSQNSMSCVVPPATEKFTLNKQ